MRSSCFVGVLVASSCVSCIPKANTLQGPSIPSNTRIGTASDPIAKVRTNTDVDFRWDDSPIAGQIIPIRRRTVKELGETALQSDCLFIDHFALTGSTASVDCRLVRLRPDQWLKRSFMDLAVAQYDASGQRLDETLVECWFSSEDYSKKGETRGSIEVNLLPRTAMISIAHIYYGTSKSVVVRPEFMTKE